MAALDTLLQVVIYGGFALYAYSKIKGQSTTDTIEELKEFIKSFNNE